MLCCYFRLDYNLSTILVGLAGLLLSCIITFGNTELTTSTQCSGTSSHRPVSDYVWAYKTRLQPGKSCDTNLTSESGEEVHLIVVNLPSSSSSSHPSSSSSSSSSNSGYHLHLHHHHRNGETGGGRRTVRLTVLSRHKGTQLQYQDALGPQYNVSNRPITFILVASVPVRWHVTLQGVPSAKEKHLFIIAKDCNIKFSRKRTRLLAKSRKRDLPLWSHTRDLLSWTERRFGAITSRNEISSEDVKLFVGRDDHSSNVQCNDDQMTTSGRIFSSYGVAKKVDGCVAVGYTHFMDAQTFVIELLKAPPVPTTITLEILHPTEAPPIITTREGLITRGDSNGRRRPEESSDSPRIGGKGGINIVVKSPPHNVKWMLRSGHNEEGVLNIVSNVDVNFKGVKASTEVSIRIEELDVTGQDLLRWTHNYVAPVQMYAGVQDVDTILIKKPPREKIKTQETSNSNNNNNNKAPNRNGAARNNNNKNNNNNGDKNRNPTWPQGNGGLKGFTGIKGTKGSGRDRDREREVISQMIQTRCDGDHMEVAIAKNLIKIASVDKSKISLQDPSCRMSDETDKFIILRTGLHDCGTHLLSMDNVNSYSNVVLIRTPPNLINNLLQDELGSGFFEEELGSGTRSGGAGSNNVAETAGDGQSDSSDKDREGNGGMFEDDEDFTPSLVRISVECRAPEIKQATTNRKPGISPREGQSQHGGSITRCNMSVYDSLFFYHPMTHFPVSVTKDNYLHIKASLIGKDKTLIVDKCLLSTSNLLHDSSAFTKDIITQGCHRTKLLEWMDETDAPIGMDVPETKFRFKLDEDFLGQPAIYLHCQFHTCHRDNMMGAHQCSIDPEERCRKASLSLKSSPSRPVDCGPLFIGPLELKSEASSGTSGTEPEPNGSKDKAAPGTDQSGQQQRVIVEGLDSPTVVGIAFASFIIGIVLVGVLWFIHSHTGPVKNGSSSRSSRSEVNASGDITPNSSSPMTA